jgi:hypothetical protein
VPEDTFKVHYQDTEPLPSWSAWKMWQTGSLTVHDERAEFASKSGESLLIRNVSQVSQPSRSQLRRQRDLSWVVNTWIAIRYFDDGRTRTAWFNDARYPAFFGHYLSHKRMRRSLDGLVGGTN